MMCSILTLGESILFQFIFADGSINCWKNDMCNKYWNYSPQNKSMVEVYDDYGVTNSISNIFTLVMKIQK